MAGARQEEGRATFARDTGQGAMQMQNITSAADGGNSPQVDRQFLLASMRVASLHYKSWANEIDMIGVALTNNQMALDTALEWLDDLGLLNHLPPPQIDGEAAA
jgi:hypothetical protein